MNDRFDRLSDGSYAQAERQTYIRELEELNINVQDLLFGISFRYENAAENHYFGSISRLGRALAESNNKEEIEQSMTAIIKDTELDLYNRLLFYFLFKNYCNHLEDEKMKAIKFHHVIQLAKSFPSHISEQLSIR